MTLKEAFKFAFQLFFIIITAQAILIVIFSNRGVDAERLLSMILLATTACAPVLVLVPRKLEKSDRILTKNMITRYCIHFILTTIGVYGVWVVRWGSFRFLTATTLTLTYIAFYSLANIIWWKLTIRLRHRMLEAEALAGSQAKNRFLAHMSHEIRTPIVSVLGIAEIQFHKTSHRPESQQAFLQIYNAATTLTDILNSILDLSKIEADKLELESKIFDVPRMVQDVVQLHVASLEVKGFRFRVSIDEHIPHYLIGDELRIRQILNNLLSNSFKYTESGVVTLDIKCEFLAVENKKNFIAIIEDTGHGMTTEQVNLLLQEDYVRFSAANQPRVQGTGLGISIVQKLLTLMKGDLQITSSLGVGTKVTVTIPLKVEDKSPIGVKTAKRLEQFEAVSPSLTLKTTSMPWARVLVVDDIESNLYVAEGLLKLYKLQVETCNCAEDAINKIKNGKVYDAIFMDYMMPGTDGIAATKILRELGYTNTIIALSANVFSEQKEEFLRNGFNDFLAKPIKSEILHGMLVKYIRNNVYSSPVSKKEDIDDYYNQPKTQALIKSGFYKIHDTTIPSIKKAMQEGNNKAAMVAAHTMKSYALMLSEEHLGDIAKQVEASFVKEVPLSDELLNLLEEEINTVAEKLRG